MRKDIYEVLESLNIEYKEYDHPAVYTVEEAEEYDRGSGAHSKNLFLRNKKGNHHYLVVVDASKRVNLKDLEKRLQESGLSFASAERMDKYLGLTPGAVSPFGLINDTDKEVRVVVDTDLLEFSEQGFHPNVNTATLTLSTNDFKRFLESTSNAVTYLKV